ncbi:hypothetical protein F9L16_15860 [Agarivorans sp. B2Z047]|uniref:hypothetical protein n=1 Tax=Agarivorans sp. B2Z047 TaxID=2652721 RepID=UPI00128E26A5|nr:hypothetical protein [Agarivorans sp. B2Z047]MPW30462.1 hypothetical protein [Agarivorans sp. B2Z047]UQN42317.1 hypothetical protein LQZ07_21480 [Agarivorans sp. B2Z047]
MSRPDFNIGGSTVAIALSVVDYLKPHLEGTEREIDKVHRVERHIGRFDSQEDIKRFMSGKDGGVRLSVLRVDDIRLAAGRGTVGLVTFAAFVFCSDMYSYDRDIRCEVITGRLAQLLWKPEAGEILGAERMPANVKMENLYSSRGDTKDATGVAIWAVMWQQEWLLDIPLDEATLDDFLRLHLKQIQAEDGPVQDSTINVRENHD